MLQLCIKYKITILQHINTNIIILQQLHRLVLTSQHCTVHHTHLKEKQVITSALIQSGMHPQTEFHHLSL